MKNKFKYVEEKCWKGICFKGNLWLQPYISQNDIFSYFQSKAILKFYSFFILVTSAIKTECNGKLTHFFWIRREPHWGTTLYILNFLHFQSVKNNCFCVFQSTRTSMKFQKYVYGLLTRFSFKYPIFLVKERNDLCLCLH